MDDERFVTSTLRGDDDSFDTSLRPHTLREYVGQ